MNLIAPESLDITGLPCIPLHKRRALPNIPAIYFVLSPANEVLYIGLARSLCLRWMSHHRIEQFRGLVDLRIAWLEVVDASQLPNLEKTFITHFQPACNTGRKKASVIHLHLKTDRAVRDQLLGALRARGTTMQQFFDTLMRMLVEHPEYIDQIEHWDDDDEETDLSSRYALAAASP